MNDDILTADREARVRQRYASSACVPVLVTQALPERAFVPLSHPPGLAQLDFGEAVAEIADSERCKAALRISAGCDRGQQVPVGLAGVEQ